MSAEGGRSDERPRSQSAGPVSPRASLRPPPLRQARSLSGSGCRSARRPQIINPEGAAWASEPAVKEINAWVVVAPDETVTIRIAQTELGQGVWTSNAMMVCEELQCDWSKVRPQYASVNRDGREMAPEWTLEVMGKGATDPTGGGEPEFGTAQPDRHRGYPEQPLPAHADQRRFVGEGRPLLSSACRRGGARALAAGGRQVVGRAGRRGAFGQRRHHPSPDRADHHLRSGRRRWRRRRRIRIPSGSASRRRGNGR